MITNHNKNLIKKGKKDMQEFRTKKLVTTIPEWLFVELQKKHALTDIDNTVVRLLIQYYHLEG